MRDNYHNSECRLDLTGSDPCEVFFSINGQWTGNHHAYSFADMKRSINNMARLQLIRTSPDGPVLKKAHKKQEDVWSKQYEKSEFAENLFKTYPAKDEEIVAWDQGVERARNDLRSIGICPSDNIDSTDENNCFFTPYGCNEKLDEIMSSEAELEALVDEETDGGGCSTDINDENFENWVT